MMHGLRIAKPHLRLGRMNVDIDLIGRQLEKEKSHGISAGHEQTAISLLQCVAQAAVANPSAVDKQILQLGVAPLVSRVHDVPAQERRSLPGLERINPLTDIGPEERSQAFVHFHSSGNLMDALIIMSKGQVQAGMSQGQSRECLADMTKLGAGRAKKGAANRRVKEQIANLDARAGRSVPRSNGRED